MPRDFSRVFNDRSEMEEFEEGLIAQGFRKVTYVIGQNLEPMQYSINDSGTSSPNNFEGDQIFRIDWCEESWYFPLSIRMFDIVLN